MKSIVTFICFFTIVSTTWSQSIEVGKKAFYNERYESARQIFNAITKAEPSNAEAWYWLTRTVMHTPDSATAAKTLLAAPTGVAQEPYYWIATGAALLGSNRVAEARAQFDQAITATKGKDEAILAAVADAVIESSYGDNAWAIELLQKAIKGDKKNAAYHISMGKAYRELHDGTNAYKAFTEAIEKDKHAAAAYYELGQIFLSQKNVEMYTSYFNKAIEADDHYAPAYYAMYDHYLYRDAAMAAGYFQRYAANSDKTLQQQYSYTDLLYLNKKYDSAIAAAKTLISGEGIKVQPRLYKLLAYSSAELKDSTAALAYMKDYFSKGIDTGFITKDFETMSVLFSAVPGGEDSPITYLTKAVYSTEDAKLKSNYYRQLAALSKKVSDHDGEAHWLGQVYASDANATNVTLFNWGLAAYKAADYEQADSVFGLYTTKYPEQGYGYYWRARSNAAIDTAMEQGLAVPHYKQLVQMMEQDSTLSATDKKWMKEAYGYLAGYEANTEKDYPEAIDYFERLLKIDPANDQAKKYIDILEKNIEIKNKTNSTESAGSN